MNRRSVVTNHLNQSGIINKNAKCVYTLPLGPIRYHKKIPTKRRTSEKNVTKLMREYIKETSFHGLKYIFYEGSSIPDRLLWLLVFLVSLGCTIALCSSMVADYLSGPTTTVVKDTHYPVHMFPFPGISICPTDKIKRNTAFTYIYQQLNMTSGELSNDSVDQFLSAMYFFKHPTYRRMKEYLDNCKDILPRLATLNLTDLMLEVLPSCKEIFSECSWHGMSEDCCELFHKQRSEEGFCYSFNTYTSQDVRSWYDFIIYEDATHSVDKYLEGSQTPTNCVLRRTSASGTTTGLEVFLKRVDSKQRLVNHTSIVGESGVTVQVHTSDEYPESGMGVMVPATPGIRMSTSIKTYITESLPAVRTLSISQRNCYFPDEIELGLAAQYSQRSCYIECRLDYFHKVCGCRPYYFNMIDNRVPVCNALQLRCVAENGENAKFFRPPADSAHRGFTVLETHHSLECSRCLPTCIESYYTDDEDISTDTQQRAQNSFGYLDLYYKSGGAIYYERDVTFGWQSLLVAIGGTAGLFLGISLLSVVELLYWVVKICYVGLTCKRFVGSTSKLPKDLVYHRDFY